LATVGIKEIIAAIRKEIGKEINVRIVVIPKIWEPLESPRISPAPGQVKSRGCAAETHPATVGEGAERIQNLG
jgi:hypothetical protein